MVCDKFWFRTFYRKWINRNWGKIVEIRPITLLTLNTCTVLCISLETRSVARQTSVAAGWVKIKILSMAQLKGLTAKFKLM